MEDAVHAIMMAFSALIFVIAFSVAMYMFSQTTTTAENLALYADSTLYYDNIKLSDSAINDGKSRLVNGETIIPLLYRYADESFAIQIYNKDDELVQIFDLDLEGKVAAADGDTNAKPTATEYEHISNYAYNQIYNNASNKNYYFFGVPWLNNKENIKQRVDLFINGQDGYIDDRYVNYKDNEFKIALDKNIQFKENFINYTWSGETMTNDDGDILVTKDAPKDKIIIIYTITEKISS